jgi:hypothetical protein
MQTTAAIDKAHADAITQNLNAQGHPVAVSDVIPTTASTPFPATEEIKAVGGKVEESDLGYAVGRTMGDLTSGASPSRMTPSKNFLGTLIGRIKGKTKSGEEVVIGSSTK